MCELQASYSLNEPIVNDSNKVEALLFLGKHVVIEQTAVYCPRTDGLVGTELRIRSIHDDRDSAMSAYRELKPADDEYDDGHAFVVRSPLPPIVPAEATGEELPF